MALSCGAKCAKGVLFTFNLIFWLSGCALIAFGIFILIEEEKSTLFPLFREDQYAGLQYLAFGCIGIGGLVFIVGFFGCCGAMQENKCMLVAYFIFLFVIFGAELAVGVFGFIFQSRNDGKLEVNLKEALRNEYGEDTEITKALDLAQTKFQCCGITEPTDYANSEWKKRNGGKSVTPTCCVLRNANITTAYLNPQPLNETLCQRDDATNMKFRHQKGCLNKLESFIKQESILFIAVGCGIAALEETIVIYVQCFRLNLEYFVQEEEQPGRTAE